jgi:RNase P protein component
MVAPEPYLSAYLAVVRWAILETRALAWGNDHLRNRLSRRRSALMADLQDAIHVIVELIPEWERCDEPALRRNFLQAFDEKWGRREESKGSLIAILDQHLLGAAKAEPP